VNVILGDLSREALAKREAKNPMRRRAGWPAALALCLASGLMGAASFAPVQAWPVAWVALAPMFWVVFTHRPGQAIVGAWLGGSVFIAGVMYWVARFGYLPWLLLAAIEGLAAAGAAASIIIARPAPGWRRVAFAALAWTAWDWLRTLGPFGVPWAQLGHSQIVFLPVAQIAAVAGVDGVTLLLALFSAAVADAVARCAAQPGAALQGHPEGDPSGSPEWAAVPRSGISLENWRAVIIVAALAAIAAAWGDFHIASVERAHRTEDYVRTALIQASVEPDLTARDVNRPITLQERERYLALHESLTMPAAKRNPHIIIWPESALPGDPVAETDIMARLSRLARKASAWLIVGGHTWKQEREYNSGFLIAPDGTLRGRYDKVHLVPFGEYVPGRHWLPLLQHYQVLAVDIAAGRGFVTWRCGATVGPMICFESAFPHISRSLRRMGAQVLVVMTNDAWFGKTAAAEQHMQIGRFRAIEEGVSVVRAAASGISCAISPTGRIISRTRLAERQALIADVPAATFRTVYSATGPALPAICWLVIIAALAMKVARRPQASSSAA
jgi:apolipoprotein N-acyltransferase